MSKNSAGNSVFIAAKVNDDTGITTTVATAGTPVALKSATLLSSALSDDSGLITLSATNGTFTLDADNQSVEGKYRLHAQIGNLVGGNAKLVTGKWFINGTAADHGTAQVKMAASAVECTMVAESFVELERGDVVDFRYDSTSNGDTVVTKRAVLSLTKLGDL